jgi:hypothetical protein
VEGIGESRSGRNGDQRKALGGPRALRERVTGVEPATLCLASRAKVNLANEPMSQRCLFSLYFRREKQILSVPKYPLITFLNTLLTETVSLKNVTMDILV